MQIFFWKGGGIIVLRRLYNQFFFSFSRYIFSVIFFLYLYASSLIAVSIFMEVYLVHRTELKIDCRGRVYFDNIVLIDRDSSCRAALAFALAKIMNE